MWFQRGAIWPNGTPITLHLRWGRFGEVIFSSSRWCLMTENGSPSGQSPHWSWSDESLISRHMMIRHRDVSHFYWLYRDWQFYWRIDSQTKRTATSFYFSRSELIDHIRPLMSKCKDRRSSYKTVRNLRIQSVTGTTSLANLLSCHGKQRNNLRRSTLN